MRRVSQQEWVWKRGGVAATDVAALFYRDVYDDRWPLRVWAEKVVMRERAAERQRQRAQVKKVTLEQGSAEWLQWRKDGLGGSELGAVMGVSRFDDPLSVYKEKVGETTGKSENADMRRGKDLEAAARELYEDIYGWKVTPVCVLHDTHDFVRASLDGLRGDDDLVAEIKAPKLAGHTKNLGLAEVADDEIRELEFKRLQPWYWYQVQYQMLITAASRCHFISYAPTFVDGHRKLAVVPLRRSDEECRVILDRVVEFWEFVRNRTPPPVGW